jgi:type IV pilus assembly protein PilW
LTSLPGGTPGNVNDNPAGAIATGLISPGTDILVFRNIQQPGQKLARTLQPDGDPVVTAPAGNPGFGVDDIVMVSDCQQAVVIRVTGMNVVGDEVTLLHTMGAGPFDNAVAIATPIGLVPFTMSILGRSYGAEASVGAVESTFFFVAPSTRQDRQGNTPLALWQKVGRTGPVELIQGVDDLQVRYGIDTTLADGIANSNQYVSFDSVPANVGQIVAVRVAIAVNSVDAVTDDGNRLQRTFSKTIMVRNANPEA